MLDELTISRFKSIKSLKLDFGQVNLFIGGNGTGKTNLLEAVGLLSACLRRGLGDTDIGTKGLRLTPPELMKSSFKNESLPKTLKLHGKFAGGTEYKAVLRSREYAPLLLFNSEIFYYHGKRRFTRNTGVSNVDRLDPNRGIWDQVKANSDIPKDVGDAFANFLQYVIYTPQTDFLRGRQSGIVDMPPLGLRGEGLSEAIASFQTIFRNLNMSKNLHGGHSIEDWKILSSCAELVMLPGWAKQFGVHNPEPELISRDLFDRSSRVVYFKDRFMHASRNLLSVYDSSEGTLFLLFVAIILSHPDAPKIFALDNVDNALNPKLTRKLVEQIIRVANVANSRGRKRFGAQQVFLTSHNPTALDAFDLFDDRVRVFVVKRNKRGHTTADRLKPRAGMNREDWRLRMKGRNLSQIWLDGDIPGAMGVSL